MAPRSTSRPPRMLVTVQPGETTSSVAGRIRTTTEELVRHNPRKPLVSVRGRRVFAALRPGERLVVPQHAAQARHAFHVHRARTAARSPGVGYELPGTCPDGTHWDEGDCVATTSDNPDWAVPGTCGPGTHWDANTGGCCPDGSHGEGGTCVCDEYSCPPGYSWHQDICACACDTVGQSCGPGMTVRWDCQCVAEDSVPPVQDWPVPDYDSCPLPNLLWLNPATSTYECLPQCTDPNETLDAADGRCMCRDGYERADPNDANTPCVVKGSGPPTNCEAPTIPWQDPADGSWWCLAPCPGKNEELDLASGNCYCAGGYARDAGGSCVLASSVPPTNCPSPTVPWQDPKDGVWYCLAPCTEANEWLDLNTATCRCKSGYARVNDGPCVKGGKAATTCPGGKAPLPDGTCPDSNVPAKTCPGGAAPLADGTCPPTHDKQSAEPEAAPIWPWLLGGAALVGGAAVVMHQQSKPARRSGGRTSR